MSGCERKVSPVVVLSPNGAYLRNDSFYGLLGVENDALSQSAGMGPQFKILVRIQNAGQGLGRFRDDCGICGKINGGVLVHHRPWFVSMISCGKNWVLSLQERLE